MTEKQGFFVGTIPVFVDPELITLPKADPDPK